MFPFLILVLFLVVIFVAVFVTVVGAAGDPPKKLHWKPESLMFPTFLKQSSLV